jgi:hypothetical protein
MRIQSSTVGQFYGTATVFSDGDADASNDQRTLSILIEPAVDAALVAPEEVRAQVDTPFEFSFSVEASTQPIGATTVELENGTIPAPFEIESLSTESGTCEASGASGSCLIDPLPARGSATIHVRARGAEEAYDSLYVRAETAGDVDRGNNSRGVYIRIEPDSAPPPQPDPGDSSSSGAGGGGRADGAMLVGLSLLAAAMRRRRVLAIGLKATLKGRP